MVICRVVTLRCKADKTTIMWKSNAEGILKYSHNGTIQCLACNPITQQLASATAMHRLWCAFFWSVLTHASLLRSSVLLSVLVQACMCMVAQAEIRRQAHISDWWFQLAGLNIRPLRNTRPPLLNTRPLAAYITHSPDCLTHSRSTAAVPGGRPTQAHRELQASQTKQNKTKQNGRSIAA